MALKEEKGHSALKYQEITGVMEISAAAGGKRVSLSAEQLLFRWPDLSEGWDLFRGNTHRRGHSLK